MSCDHPKCTDDEHKTYHDEHDNELALCEAHYYYLVSGDRPSTLQPDRTPGFGRPRREVILDEAQGRGLSTAPDGFDLPEKGLQTDRRER
jgi:hypothetical protein